MASNPVTTAEHLRNALDGRWRGAKNQMRARLADEIFRPHYTPNTVIARTKVAEQMKIMAAAGAAESAFRKEHGGTGDLGAAITAIEMLAMSDLSLMVKAGCSGVCSAGPWKTWAPNATTRRM
ncbi:acyl-CoA dehydrogenase, N-terminal domain protein [Mycobacterium xenopi 4042]|uniref:Acyl-CoA dehydrogenase, N-terminal domain protein n=1 Tax=Mycobacterium xenopi 4042 TaxID=1299334 RepID=X8AP81_MYCXE|nr:acyl-CoA dehydrogenase, N-terminal domain protein [Mycobacterium xenopi 4042]